MSSLSLFTPLRQSEVVQGPGRDFDLGPRTFPGCSWCPLTSLLLPGYISTTFARKLITWRDPKETTATVAPALVTWTWSWEVVRPFNLDSFHTNAHKFGFFFGGLSKKRPLAKRLPERPRADVTAVKQSGGEGPDILVSYLTRSWTRSLTKAGLTKSS